MENQISALHSRKLSVCLEQIAGLRALGVGNHIDLPQLVVSSDQSAGKGSVLEGLTGLPSPRQDGGCTRFVTEILLHNNDSEDMTIVATLIPCKNCDEQSSSALRANQSDNHIASGLGIYKSSWPFRDAAAKSLRT